MKHYHANVQFVSLARWRPSFKMNEDFRALKDALENLNTGKSPSRRILKGIFSNNTETCKLIGQSRPCHGFRRHIDE